MTSQPQKYRLNEAIEHILSEEKTSQEIRPPNSTAQNLKSSLSLVNNHFKNDRVSHWYGEKRVDISEGARKYADSIKESSDFEDSVKYYFMAIITMPEPSSDNGRLELLDIYRKLEEVYTLLGAVDRQAKTQKNIQLLESNNYQLNRFLLIHQNQVQPKSDLKKPNSLLTNASSKINLSNDKNYGGCRLLKANEKINFGEVVIEEKATVSKLNDELLYEKCYHCFQTLVAPFPCPQCNGVSYCDETCQKLSWENDGHKIECKYLASLMFLDRPSHMMFRMILFGLRNDEGYFRIDGEAGEPVSELDKNSYKRVLDLHEETPADFEMVKTMFLQAAGFLKILKQENVIDTKKHNFNKVFKVTILHGMQHLANGINLHSIYENKQGNAHHTESQMPLHYQNFEVTYQDKTLAEYYSYAKGIFTTTAMMNHSCLPNVGLCFKNESLIAFALRDIRAGEQLVINYGRPVLETPSAEARRNHYYNQYKFVCECVACENNWPAGVSELGSLGAEAVECLKLSIEGKISNSFEAARIAVNEYDGRDISELSYSELEFIEKVPLVIERSLTRNK